MARNGYFGTEEPLAPDMVAVGKGVGGFEIGLIRLYIPPDYLEMKPEEARELANLLEKAAASITASEPIDDVMKGLGRGVQSCEDAKPNEPQLRQTFKAHENLMEGTGPLMEFDSPFPVALYLHPSAPEGWRDAKEHEAFVWSVFPSSTPARLAEMERLVNEAAMCLPCGRAIKFEDSNGNAWRGFIAKMEHARSVTGERSLTLEGMFRR